ncbi:MAG: T9SS type A sorting domain-containing protein [Bacteroidota bacterium]
MNRLLQLFSALTILLTSQTISAQIINAGFETWTNDAIVPTAMNPNSGSGTSGWWDFNYFNSSSFGSSPVSVTRCSDTVRTGTYSARIQTRAYTSTSWNIYNSWGTPFIGHPYNDTLGILFNGNVNLNTQKYYPGIPFTQKISQLKFFYQYKPNGNDTAVCRVLLVNQRVPIAGGVFKTNVPTGASGWQQATINLTYINTLTPDTIWVLMSSSSLDKNPKAGSILWVDDVSVTLPTGFNELIGSVNDIEIFPNPSNGVISIHSETINNEEQFIEVYNMLGSKIHSSAKSRLSAYTFDISHQPKGIYFVKVYRGEKCTTRRIIVQ